MEMTFKSHNRWHQRPMILFQVVKDGRIQENSFHDFKMIFSERRYFTTNHCHIRRERAFTELEKLKKILKANTRIRDKVPHYVL